MTMANVLWQHLRMPNSPIPVAAMVEITGEEILEGAEKVLAVLNQLQPEVGVAICVLLAYSLTKGQQLNAQEAQGVLNRFTTLVFAGELDIQ